MDQIARPIKLAEVVLAEHQVRLAPDLPEVQEVSDPAAVVEEAQ
jgi:hypothetical protein